MTRILVTGGAGFIGTALRSALSAVDHEVVVLDDLHPQVHRDPDAVRRSLGGILVEADVRDDAAWTDLPPVDAVVHLAAETGVGQSMYEVDRYRSVNVDGTRNAARFAVGRGVPLIFFSSRAVYGEGRVVCPVHAERIGGPCCDRSVPAPSREDDGFAPVSVYGETKVEAEQVLGDGVAGEIPVSVLRPQNVIGEGQSLHNPYTGVLAAFLAGLREGRPLRIYGDGHQTRDFVHVSDVVAVVLALLTRRPEVEGVCTVNVGSGVRTSLIELVGYAIAAAPAGGTYEHVDVHRAGDIEHACADLDRLVSYGLPRPRVPVADAVGRFIRDGWTREGAPATAWDAALDTLERHGLLR